MSLTRKRRKSKRGLPLGQNCVVDGRWTVRLTDYGLPEILREQRLKGAIQFRPFKAESGRRAFASHPTQSYAMQSSSK